MDWEYQSHGPMDPSSPFAQSTKHTPKKSNQNSCTDLLPGRGTMEERREKPGANTTNCVGVFSSASMNDNDGGSKSHSSASNGNNDNNAISAFGRNPFYRAQSTPSQSKPSQSPLRSIFSTSALSRTAAAPPFRNPAFTTPRRPFDIDALSEDSPTITDVSDFIDTPENDRSYDMGRMTVTPATMNRERVSPTKKTPGKGEIPKTIFASRDKVRKRKRYNGDRDISGYRLPYIQPDEYDESDYESDESTFQPRKPRKGQEKRGNGWFGNFLATVQRHPYAPSILGYWLTLGFNLFCVLASCWIGWAVIAGLRQDFATARAALRADILSEIDKCASDYRENKCFPVEQRLPAMYELCDRWYACMQQNPDHLKQMSIGAKEIMEIVNGIVDTMSYKTIALFVLLFTIFIFSGRSLYKSTNAFAEFPRSPPAAPYPSHAVAAAPPLPQQVYWQAIAPQTPHRSRSRHMINHEEDTPETPETTGSPRGFPSLPPPETPVSLRRSPSKGRDRARSPSKNNRSPTKRY
ncbi:Di-sulfide bridge nucleocytoplasmic transport domain-containing protein [Durotheca rogersii]|uniref:Di-sulfide bridge nucleocytoplasmic transport domain-containing protein n=1 Tax=Durotheca rogersii TaxID=419775 RepID=UPI0022201535|nr:Di-sulfide bridge nucleocytoplasmic transport domain-containing protein [Durotheca rogersii]KAI5861013.1 Di-sulfide bridge nucleocytoplasmic transport domain-containing protein [Durotheca rogersii]